MSCDTQNWNSIPQYWLLYDWKFETNFLPSKVKTPDISKLRGFLRWSKNTFRSKIRSLIFHFIFFLSPRRQNNCLNSGLQTCMYILNLMIIIMTLSFHLKNSMFQADWWACKQKPWWHFCIVQSYQQWYIFKLFQKSMNLTIVHPTTNLRNLWEKTTAS